MKLKELGKRLIVAAGLVTTLSVFMFPVSHVYAETTREKLERAEKEHAETKNQLNETKKDISSMEGEKESLQGQLERLNRELTLASENLTEIENKVEIKEKEIRETEADLEEAKKTEATQYENMKQRIKAMYETKNTKLMELYFGRGQFTGNVNYKTYVEKLTSYDEKMLNEYETARQEVEDQKEILLMEKEDLNLLRVAAANEQKKAAGCVKETNSNIHHYSNQIEDAEKRASEMAEKAKEEEKDIAALKKKLAEEIALSKLAAQSSWRDISEVQFSEDDRYLLANLIYCEAGGEPYAGQLAVGAVVVNRVLSSIYPDTVVGVIYQNKQFSPVGDGHLALALAENRATPACYKAADEAMSGQTNVGNCVYFRTPIEGLTGISIGGHIFY